MNQKPYLLCRYAGVLVLLLFLASGSLLAQGRRVTGKVNEAQGSLPGATVLVKGTTNGTVTDADGDFAIPVPGNDAVLVISATGYQSVELAVGSQTSVEVRLEESASSLSEIVVTGYTVDTRRQTTSAVATVKTKDLSAVPTGNVEQQLQGRVAGLTVITNGQPGTDSQVRIRGFGSFGGNQPLYVVDGVPTQNINFLAPDDIENTTVMKDASSASIYGARAASGVIVITTKKGSKKPQKMQVNYDALVGWTNPGTGAEILNPQEQADWTWTALKNAGLPTSHPQYGSGDRPTLPDFINVGGEGGLSASQVNLAEEQKKYNVNPDNGSVYQIVRANKAGTDWYGAITRTAPMTRHNLGFTGATENVRYYLGLSLQDQAGIMLNNDFKRHTFRSNVEFDLGKRVRVGENLQFTYRQVLGLSGGGNGANVSQDENSILGAFRMPAIIPVYDEYGGYGGTAAKGFNNPRNPVAERDGVKDNRAFGTSGFGNLYAELDVMEGLTLRTSIGGNYGNFYGYGFTRVSYENSENNSSFGYNEFAGNNFSWVFTNTAQYKKQFGNNKIELLLGQEALTDGKFRQLSGSGLNPFSTDPDYITLSTVSNRVVNSFNQTAWNYFSLFGRVHYSLLDKYYVTALLRRDGSSRFGSNNRYGVFPGISAAWRVSGEEFMKGSSWIDDLKIRGGWGQMGNDQVRPTNQYSLFASSLGNAAYPIDGGNGGVAEGFYQSQVGNPNAKWEVSTTSNIGFDALFLQGKLDVVVDLWKKNTDELLFNPPQSQVLGGFANAPFQNVASMVNKGIDLQIINKGKFGARNGYELTLTASWLNNEITKVADNLTYFDVAPASNRLASTMVRNQVGYSISAFYGYQVLGFFKDQAEVDGAPDQEGAGPGRFRYADLNGLDDNGNLTGLPDGKIDAADRTYIGSPVPKFTGGINLKVTVGQFDVETYLYTSIGNKIFHLAKWFTDFYPSFKGAAIGSRVKDSWTPDNTGADTPIFEDVSNFSTNTQPNSWYVEDGSFLRLQNLTLGYNLSGALKDRLKLKRARVFVGVNNLLTITGYKGLD
ncbi:MAG: TonB-dependent receptor, partial [Saprospiraceae bacterium]|nr:TonB-dependent receptor [Saprospiraceae bacterium]